MERKRGERERSPSAAVTRFNFEFSRRLFFIRNEINNSGVERNGEWCTTRRIDPICQTTCQRFCCVCKKWRNLILSYFHHKTRSCAYDLLMLLLILAPEMGSSAKNCQTIEFSERSVSASVAVVAYSHRISLLVSPHRSASEISLLPDYVLYSCSFCSVSVRFALFTVGNRVCVCLPWRGIFLEMK